MPQDSKHDAPKMDDQQTAKLRKKNLAHKLKKRALKAACKAANHAVGLPRNVASSSQVGSLYMCAHLHYTCIWQHCASDLHIDSWAEVTYKPL